MPIAPNSYYAPKTRPPSARQPSRRRVLVEIDGFTVTRRSAAGSTGPARCSRQLAAKAASTAAGVTAAGRTADARCWPAGRPARPTFVTTRPDPAAARPPDLVKRDFTADRAEPAVGRGLHLCADVVGDGVHRVRLRRVQPPDRRLAHRDDRCRPTCRLDALEMALWTRSGQADRARGRLEGLIHHSDAGSQGGLNRSSQHLVILEVLRWCDVSNRRTGLCGRRCAHRVGRSRPGTWNASSGG